MPRDRSKSRPRTKRGKSSDRDGSERNRSRSNDGGKNRRGKSSDRRSRSNDGGKKDTPRKTKKTSKQRREGRTKYADDENPDLVELEERLTEEVDDEFFQDPRKFHTLNRIIDVLGMQLSLNDDASSSKRRKRQTSGKKEAPRIDRNPAYRALVAQRDVVEEAIEHLALIHCADLNGSVVQVGRVARQFHDAVSQVQSLRKQVKDIQETLGAGSHRNGVTFDSAGIAVNASGTPIDGNRAKDVEAREAARAAASSAMSLRELWLKKLEAEAVLALLDKLDTIRAAPMKFDDLLRQHRIGAAVLTVSNGLDTMFMSDVNQVQALHKIMEQLMIRKQKAEEVVWELLSDVLFLRTGNGMAQLVALGSGAGEALFNNLDKTKGRPRRIAANASTSGDNNSIIKQDSTDGSISDPNKANSLDGNNSIVAGSSVNSGIPGRQQLAQQSNNPSTNPLAAASYLWNLPPSGWDYIRRQQMGMVNPFLTVRMRFALDPDDLQLESILRNIEAQQRERERGRLSDGVDEDFYDDEEEESSLFGQSRSTSQVNDESKDGSDANGTNSNFRPEAVIPVTMMDAEFDLEADERRSLEEQQYDSQGRRRQQALHMKKPTYLDHVLALRTLVECLVRLRRLDDVERIVTDALEKELSQLVQREQARTFLWVEKSSTDRLRKGAGGRYAALLNKAGSGIDLRDFRQHLNHILSAFGNVQIRLIHLTQIIRHRIVSTILNLPSLSSALRIDFRKFIAQTHFLFLCKFYNCNRF